ncbi:hypothetical protein ACFT1A_02220 [Rhodococcus sp. NPDC057135]|uniref:hypothetical protein n=1 Tax=Rhodococcus sp. NPDC057135 TaxID=3346028 RepID=UPI00363324C9
MNDTSSASAADPQQQPSPYAPDSKATTPPRSIPASRAITEPGWTVTREHIDGETYGRTSLDGSRRIIVDDTISDAQVAKTID